MSQSNKEARITLALQAYQADPKLSLRRAAFMYDVHFRTLHHRSKGKEARDDWVPTQRKLSDLEEEVIVQYILDLDLRGFPSRHRDVEEMGIDCLLTATHHQLASAGLSILLSDNQSLRHVLGGNMTIGGLNAKIRLLFAIGLSL